MFPLSNDISQHHHHFDSMLQHHFMTSTNTYIHKHQLLSYPFCHISWRPSWPNPPDPASLSAMTLAIKFFRCYWPLSECVIIIIHVHLEAQVVALLRTPGTWFTSTFGKVLIYMTSYLDVSSILQNDISQCNLINCSCLIIDKCSVHTYKLCYVHTYKAYKSKSNNLTSAILRPVLHLYTSSLFSQFALKMVLWSFTPQQQLPSAY